MSRRFDNFAARLEGDGDTKGDPGTEPAAPAPATPDEPAPDPDTDTPTDKDDEEMTTETPLEERDDYKAGHSAGLKAANDRMNAVFAHENAKGREASAAKLLGKPNMTSDDIIDVLADMPAAEQVSQEEANAAAEEAAREEMQKEMSSRGNVDLGADENKDGKTGRAKADAVWDKANAAVGRVKKEG